MGFRIINLNNEERYEYDLPDGKKYSIPKRNVDIVQEEIWEQWDCIITNASNLSEQEKSQLKKLSAQSSGKIRPPVDTKIYFTKGQATARITIPGFRASPSHSLTINLSSPSTCTIDFLVQQYKRDQETVLFFGALEKQKDKSKYMMHRAAEYVFNEKAVWFPNRIRKNDVYFFRKGNSYQVYAKTEKGELVELEFPFNNYPIDKAKKSAIEYFSKELLERGVSPAHISTRVKYFFPAPSFNLDSSLFLIKTEGIHNNRRIPLLPHLVLHESRSTQYRHLRQGFSKRRTLMPYLGKTLQNLSFRIFLKKPIGLIPENVIFVYINTADKLVYRTSKTATEQFLPENDFGSIRWDTNSNHTNDSQHNGALIEYVSSKEHISDTGSLEKRAKIAKELCEQIAGKHTNGILLVDIKPQNFTQQEDSPSGQAIENNITIIDDNAIVYRDNPDALRITPGYKAPELLGASYSAQATIESDIYATGQTIAEIFAHKADNLSKLIHSEMTHNNPKWRLDLPTVSRLLTAYENPSLKLSDFALQCLNTFKKTGDQQAKKSLLWTDKNGIHKQYQQKIKNLSILLEILSKKNQSLSYFEQQTFIQLLNQMPEYTDWNTDANIEKILDLNTGAPLTCTILGTLEYIERNKHWSTEGKSKAKGLVKKLFTIDLNNENALNQAIDDTCISSKTEKLHSRAETLHRFTQIRYIIQPLETRESFSKCININTPHQHDELIHKLSVFFPECWKESDAMATAVSKEHIRNILLKAIEYMAETQKGGHKNGRQAVRNFVKKLLDPELLLNANNYKITREKKIFLDENSQEYRCGLFGRFKSGACSDKVYGSLRKKIFEAKSTPSPFTP